MCRLLRVFFPPFQVFLPFFRILEIDIRTVTFMSGSASMSDLRSDVRIDVRFPNKVGKQGLGFLREQSVGHRRDESALRLLWRAAARETPLAARSVR